MNRILQGAMRARTIWAGSSVALSSLAVVFLDVWSALGPEEIEFLRMVFGPEMIAVIGIVMIWLRVITRKPLDQR